MSASPFGVPYALPGVSYGVPYETPSYTADDLRKLMKCIDGVFDELIGEHNELKKYYPQYKVYVEESNERLAKCEKMENPSKGV